MTEGKVTGANVSVKIDDEFMQAVINGTPYKQQYPIDSSEPTNVKEINAAELWKKIIHNAWKSAEPGCAFWDYDLERVCSRFVCGSRIPYGFDQPLR